MRLGGRSFCAALALATACALAESPPETKPPILVHVDDELAGFVGQAAVLIKSKDYDRAVEILQAVISRPDSGFVTCPDGRRYESLMIKARDLIGSMPAEGLARYRQLFDARAGQLYQQGVSTGDMAVLRRLTQQYLHTNWGVKSLEAMGMLYFDRGEFAQAAGIWERAVALAGETEAKPLLLAKLAAARCLAGQPGKARAAADLLASRYPDAAATLGGRTKKLTEFVKHISGLSAGRVSESRRMRRVWPGAGGVPNGMATMSECEVAPAPVWTHSPWVSGRKRLIAMEYFVPPVFGPKATIKLRGGQVRIDLGSRGHGWMPAAVHPVVTDKAVICREDEAVAAYDLADGRLLWRAHRSGAGAAYGRPSGSGSDLGDPGLYALTAAAGKVFALEGRRAAVGGASCLAAYDVRSGKLRWRVGQGRGDDKFLHACRFLCAPAYHGGRIYTVALAVADYNLVCLDGSTGSLVWHAAFAQLPEAARRLQPHPSRRTMRTCNYDYWFCRASTPAMADGMVFALTNSGVLAAFEAETGRPVWAYQYDSNVNQPASRGVGGQAMANSPNPILVSGGRVTCLPSDGQELLRLSAEDGRLLGASSRAGQRDLSAIGADRVLLSGPGLCVVSVRHGQRLSGRADMGIVGRPAVTDGAVLAGGAGRLIRMDLGSYELRLTELTGASGLLGNLVSLSDQLIAANTAGVSVYRGYQEVRSRLNRRIGRETDRRRRAELLFERGRVAFHAGRTAEAMDDLLACRRLIGPDAGLVQREDLTRWMYRTCVAMGKRAATAAGKLGWFAEAERYALTRQAKAHTLVRLAKSHVLAAEAAEGPQRVGALQTAAELAGRLATEYAGEQLVDAAVSAEAGRRTGRFDRSAAVFPADRLAREMVATWLARYGRGFYAAVEAQAKAAYDLAAAGEEPEAMVRVARRFPNSPWAGRSLLEAAERYVRQAGRRTSPQAEAPLAEARALLGEAAGRLDGAEAVTACLGLAMVYRRTGCTWMAGRTCRRARRLAGESGISMSDRFAFAGTGGSLETLLERLGSPGEPTPAAESHRGRLHPPLAKVFSVPGGSTWIVRDHDGLPVRLGRDLLLLKSDGLVRFDPAADNERQAVKWAALAPNSWTAPMSMGPVVGGVSRDGTAVTVIDRKYAASFSVDSGKLLWSRDFAALGIGQLTDGAVDRGYVVGIDGTGSPISCIDAATGRLVWRYQLSRSQRGDGGIDWIGPTYVMVHHDRFKRHKCLDLQTGKLLWRWQGAATRYLAVDGGLVAAMVDGRLTLHEAGRISRPVMEWRFSNHESILASGPGVVAVRGERTVKVLDIHTGRQVELNLQAGPWISAQPSQVSILSGQFDGGALYVAVLTGRGGPLAPRPESRQPSVWKFDAATGRLLWKVSIEQSFGFRYYVPFLSVGAKHVVVPVHPSNVRPTTTLVLDSQTGRLVGRLAPAGAAEASRPPARWGLPAIVGERLCVETHEGVTIYGGRSR